jgi:hypothetical protein
MRTKRNLGALACDAEDENFGRMAVAGATASVVGATGSTILVI